ncbi:MAG TPA: BPSS1780 family membrane protein [Methylotenera sp.]|nr:BPSS1780 family membrane protein [Methylotenera sp.]HPV44518.1 BPSS1780 family membrane protein [Methylotenera sp.]
MAIHESRTKTGISWVTESVTLFRTAPRKWLLLALAYVGLFMMIPSIPGLQFFAFISILIWPIFLAVAITLYRNADYKKKQSLGEIVQNVQPKMSQLMALGGACLLYAMVVSFVLDSDMQGLAALTQNKTEMTESQMMNFLQKMFPLLLKLTLLLIPLMMATWFSPMLIAFNDYKLVKAIKSSIAGSLQYMVALAAAWLLLTAGILALMLGVGIVAGIISSLIPGLGQVLMSMVVFGCLLLATALMLAFQYVSYRDVFRAA